MLLSSKSAIECYIIEKDTKSIFLLTEQYSTLNKNRKLHPIIWGITVYIVNKKTAALMWL